MSIESKEIKDIHALYQNLYEETARERMQRNKERVKNPLGNVTIEKEDGTKLKKGDKGFDQELEKGRKTVRDANNKSLGKDNNSSSSSSPSSSSSTSDEKKPTTTSSSSNTTKKIPGEFPGTKKEFDAKYGSDEKVVRNRRGRVINNKGSLASTEKEKVVTKSDVGSDGLSSKNKKNTTQTVDVRNRRGRVTGTKEVRVQSQQSDGGKNITNRRGRVVGTTKSTDAEGKSFPSTAEIRAKAKKDGGSGLSNIPSKEGNAVINKKPLNPDFGKKPVIQKDAPVKPIAKPAVKMSNLERQNRDRFGDAAVDKLKAKQTDFRAMQSKSMMPGAKPGAAKAEFAKKHPNSNIAKDLKKSKRVTQVMDLESYDAYDLVLIHLLETNQVESVEEANYVMTEMDGKTILEIKRLMESMPDHVRDSIGRQYGTGKYKGEKYTIEDKKNVVNWYSRIKA